MHWSFVTMLLSVGAGMVRGQRVAGLRLDQVSSSMYYNDQGIITLMEGLEVVVQVLGVDLQGGNTIKMTTEAGERGQECGSTNGTFIHTKEFTLVAEKDGENTENNRFFLNLAPGDLMYSKHLDSFHVCLLHKDGRYIHQGTNPEVTITLYQRLLPLWLMIVMVTLLLVLSGLFSGLNLGLMALDQTELQILINTGTKTEQEDAKSIMPVRSLGNFLLCSLLLGNVLVNNSLTILLDNLTGGGGLIAIIGSTFGIVVFGEIIPQAVCSRHGLAVGAKTLVITKFFMALTSPLSYPISKLLDCLLGEELGTVYNRARLIELLKVTQDNIDLNKDEVNILTGALVLQEKHVSDIMTPLADCYMLPLESLLDFNTISEIKEKGYSRIPVYKEDEANVVHVLLAKDLLFVDPDDKKPLAEVCNFYKTPFIETQRDTPLNKLLNEFKSGETGHLAMVVEEEGAVGLVTLEDIIEEIIQAEIVDETDIVMDNKSKAKRKRKARFLKEKEVRMFMEPKDNKVEVSAQLQLAVHQFLSTSLPVFHSDTIRSDIMARLLQLDVFRTSSKESEEKKDQVIFERGQQCDFFVLIVEGKAEVEIGGEGYVFESGAFTHFGRQVLEQVLAQEGNSGAGSVRRAAWSPDCTLRPKSDNVLYLRLRQNTYRAALRASRQPGSSSMEQVVASMARAQQQGLDRTDSHQQEDSPLL